MSEPPHSSPPLVAVLMPAYNAGRFIAEAIASVQAQTHPAWRLIVVDDGSTDGTAALVRACAAADARISLFSQPNGGIAAARNACLGHLPEGTVYQMNLDADDRLPPVALEQLVAYLESNREAGGVLCGARTIDASGKATGHRKTSRFRLIAGFPVLLRRPGPIPFFNFFCSYGIGPFALFRSSAFARAGAYDLRLPTAEDADHFARLALVATVHQITSPLYDYRWYGGNTSTYTTHNREAGERMRELWDARVGATPEEEAALARGRCFWSCWHPVILRLKLAAVSLRDALRSRNPGAVARAIGYCARAGCAALIAAPRAAARMRAAG